MNLRIRFICLNEFSFKINLIHSVITETMNCFALFDWLIQNSNYCSDLYVLDTNGNYIFPIKLLSRAYSLRHYCLSK